MNGPVISRTGVNPYGDSLPYKHLNGVGASTVGVYTYYGNGRVYFTTNDGVGYFIHMMDWEHEYDDDGNLVSQTPKYNTRQDVYIDVNGVNAPNTLGKDVFRFVVNFDDSVVRPLGYDRTESEINNNCSHDGSGIYCASKIINDGWQMKKDYPW